MRGSLLILARAGDSLGGEVTSAREPKHARLALWTNLQDLTGRQRAKLRASLKSTGRCTEPGCSPRSCGWCPRVKGPHAVALLDAWLGWARRCRIPCGHQAGKDRRRAPGWDRRGVAGHQHCCSVIEGLGTFSTRGISGLNFGPFPTALSPTAGDRGLAEQSPCTAIRRSHERISVWLALSVAAFRGASASEGGEGHQRGSARRAAAVPAGRAGVGDQGAVGDIGDV
jgi:hypothetical protein